MATLTYYGHGCLGLASEDGTQLIVDPFESGGLRGKIQYEPLPDPADYVVCTHAHDDHSAIDAIPGSRPIVVDRGKAGPFHVARDPFDHDEYGGERFGGRVDMVRIEVEGRTVVHASDIGQSPGPALPDRLRGADVLAVPVGGFFTAGAAQAWEWCRRLAPQVVVPVHYGTPSCELPLHPIAPFLGYGSDVRRPGRSYFELGDRLATFQSSIVVLTPVCGEADDAPFHSDHHLR